MAALGRTHFRASWQGIYGRTLGTSLSLQGPKASELVRKANHITFCYGAADMVKPTEPTRTAACMITEGGRTYCIDPLESTAQLLSKRWALLIIGAVGNQPQVRFSEVKRMIPGISSRALSDVLARLQADGLVLRDVDGTRSPPAVGYGLTGRGRSLRRALIPLLEWAEDGAPT